MFLKIRELSKTDTASFTADDKGFLTPTPWGRAQGWKSLFNGTDLTGWAGAVDNYEVADGAIRCKPGKGGVLHAKDEYSDFVVGLEFKVPPGGNNGLAIRYPGFASTISGPRWPVSELNARPPRPADVIRATVTPGI